jgi:hypothetical protein
VRAPNGRTKRYVVIAAVVVAAALVTTAQPASADPSVTVSPTRVVDGQTVTITTSDFPSGLWAALECPADLSPNAAVATAFANCRWVFGPSSGTPLPSFDGVVRASFPTIDGSRTVDCRFETAGCAVFVGVLVEGGGTVGASAPIDFGSALVVEPARGLSDGDPVSVSTGAADGPWVVAQCAVAYLEGTIGGDDACGPEQAVVVSAGVATPDVVVADPLATRAGATLPCGYDGCVLVLSSPESPIEAAGQISFGPITVTTDPPAPLQEGTLFSALVHGGPSASVDLGLCLAPASTGTCAVLLSIALDGWGTGRSQGMTADSRLFLAGVEHDCHVVTCELAVLAGDEVLATTPFTLLPAPTLSVAPASGLLEGQLVQLSATGLFPDVIHTIYRCAGGSFFSCEVAGSAAASSDGTLVTSLPVSQQLGSGSYCRDNCTFAVFAFTPLFAGYAMAEGIVDVSPSAGLTDGQVVELTGTDLMPSYAGRLIGPFPTGGWAVAQCDAAVLGELTLYGVFTQCSAGPTLRPIDVPGSTVATSVGVEATITKILGGTTNCAAGPGACVLGLFRFEQDGSISAHTVAIDFTG